jgi:hypothetical protein
MSACTVYGCARDKVYALIRSDGKLSRFSFSRSVLSHCGTFLDDGWSIKHLPFVTGEKLTPGGSSRSGVYAIVAATGSAGKTLRVCYSSEMAEMLSYPGNRDVYEFWLTED